MSSEFIHDPEGVLILKSPTKISVKSGCASSDTHAQVIPYSRKDKLDNGDLSLWAGPDTYTVPEDADFLILEMDQESIDLLSESENGDKLNIAELINHHTSGDRYNDE